MAETRVYEKHDSFVGIRHQHQLTDVLARVSRLREDLPALGLGAEMRTVVEAACRELLEPESQPANDRFTLQTYVLEEMSRLEDVALPRYLFYRYRYEMYPQRKIVDAFPPCVQIEPASICNYRCVFCYQTDKTFTAKQGGHMGLMTLDLFKSIVDQLAGNVDAITFASRGEPLISKDINSMLAYTTGKFLALKVNTNAWYLDEAKAHAILQADLNTLVFSIDAAAEPQYSQLRVGGKLDKVMANIKRFQEIRATQYPKSRLITRVSGVKVPGTPGLDDMERFWGDHVDQVAFVNYNPWENTYDQPINDLATPCSDLWRRMFIWWDGIMNPCDVDYKSTLAAGRVGDTTVSGVWTGDLYSSYRAKHLAAGRSQLSPCQRCTVI